MTDHDLSKPDISKANDCPPLPKNASALDRMVYWLGIGLGSGLPRRAPGTWGTVGGLIIAIPLMSLGFIPFLILTILSCIFGVWICGRTSELMQGHDDPHIVWDEWSGIWITLLPFSYMGVAATNFWQDVSQELSIFAIVIAFILFRFFDIIKPPPIGWADKKVAGGLGIMLDDIIAGIMAAVLWVVVMLGVLL
ncbi:phosphatidylglycerophosphatase A [Psychrobacter sp. NZS113]|jgi:phosphatidylglycerophosphatase A|uniref:phosphatidylglycerophosphatase A family protein n=1 Tax=Psychrobacter sp. NZS113 TaxID=2792045 RepID=UPI0018CCBF7B|nr:phosphatidylglycerophosphatase A [Psychrobacter sp. NZS113]MBH0097048.1 phosphatidylglycerophosphatase A [Psychrobacter sp. NZS113]